MSGQTGRAGYRCLERGDGRLDSSLPCPVAVPLLECLVLGVIAGARCQPQCSGSPFFRHVILSIHISELGDVVCLLQVTAITN